MLSIYSSETPPGSPQPGPSTAPDNDNPPPRRGRPPKRARPAPPSDDDDDSDSDDDAGNAWNNSTDLNTEPYRMRFAPSREPGFQLPRDQNWSPFYLFPLFFSQNSIDVTVKNTNKFGNKLKSDKSYFRWFQLTLKEFLAFLGIVIFMGLVEVPSLVEYWNDDGFFGQEFV